MKFKCDPKPILAYLEHTSMPRKALAVNAKVSLPSMYAILAGKGGPSCTQKVLDYMKAHPHREDPVTKVQHFEEPKIQIEEKHCTIEKTVNGVAWLRGLIDDGRVKKVTITMVVE